MTSGTTSARRGNGARRVVDVAGTERAPPIRCVISSALPCSVSEAGSSPRTRGCGKCHEQIRAPGVPRVDDVEAFDGSVGRKGGLSGTPALRWRRARRAEGEVGRSGLRSPAPNLAEPSGFRSSRRLESHRSPVAGDPRGVEQSPAIAPATFRRPDLGLGDAVDVAAQSCFAGDQGALITGNWPSPGPLAPSVPRPINAGPASRQGAPARRGVARE